MISCRSFVKRASEVNALTRHCLCEGVLKLPRKVDRKLSIFEIVSLIDLCRDEIAKRWTTPLRFILAGGKTCDECSFFDVEKNRCLNTGEKRRGGQAVCWQLSKSK